jgi:hypothetical protein
MKSYGPYQPPVNTSDRPGDTYMPDNTIDDGGVPDMVQGGGAWAEKKEIARQARIGALRNNPMFRKSKTPIVRPTSVAIDSTGRPPKTVMDRMLAIQEGNEGRLRKYENPVQIKDNGKIEYSTLPSLYKPRRDYTKV